MDNTITAKTCKKCKRFQPIECFSLDRHAKDGYQKWCKDCWHNHHPQRRQGFSLTTIVYTWNKYSPHNNGLVQKKLTEEWFCQACHDKQTDELPPYMFEYPEKEFIRICSKCHYLRLKQNIEDFATLLDLVRLNPF